MLWANNRELQRSFKYFPSDTAIFYLICKKRSRFFRVLIIKSIKYSTRSFDPFWTFPIERIAFMITGNTYSMSLLLKQSTERSSWVVLLLIPFWYMIHLVTVSALSLYQQRYRNILMDRTDQDKSSGYTLVKAIH